MALDICVHLIIINIWCVGTSVLWPSLYAQVIFYITLMNEKKTCSVMFWKVKFYSQTLMHRMLTHTNFFLMDRLNFIMTSPCYWLIGRQYHYVSMLILKFCTLLEKFTKVCLSVARWNELQLKKFPIDFEDWYIFWKSFD